MSKSHWIKKGRLLAVSGWLSVALVTACGTASPATPAAPRGGDTATPAPKTWHSPPPMTIDVNKTYRATLHTTDGDFTIELLPKTAPRTVNNFVFLAQQHFYDGVKFHRIIRSFMIQTGDPNGNGTGSPGYTFPDELHPGMHYGIGTVAMANSGPNTNGSQFFICTGPDCQYLDQTPNYTIFGQVVSGMDVVEKIAATPVGPNPDSPDREMSLPKETVRIRSITIQVQ
jgi:cyclophilin family peptidyl-prolyl cis-trans isomerase